MSNLDGDKDEEIKEAKTALILEYGADFFEPLFEKCIKLLDYFWIKPSFRRNQAKYTLQMAYRMGLGENIILQAPTGTGKTTMGITAAIIGALSPDIDQNHKVISSKSSCIFFAGRTITQSERVVEEMAEFNTAMGKSKVKYLSVQLNAKSRMCLYQGAIEPEEGDTSGDPDDEDVEDAVFGIHGRCSKARELGECPYFPKDQIDNYKLKQGSVPPIMGQSKSIPAMFLFFKDKMQPYIVQRMNQFPYKGSFDGESLRKFGLKNSLCPYYLMFGVVQLADFVTGPYIWITQSNLRDFLFMLMKETKKFIIIDEAHNFPDTCSEKGKVNFSRFRLRYLIKKAKEHEDWYRTDLVDRNKDYENMFIDFGKDMEKFMRIMDTSANYFKAIEVGKGSKSYEYRYGILNQTIIATKNRDFGIHQEMTRNLKLSPLSQSPTDINFYQNLFSILISRIDQVNMILSMKKERLEAEAKDGGPPIKEIMAKSVERDMRRFASMKDFFEIKDQNFIQYMATSYSLFVYFNHDEKKVDKNRKQFPIIWNFEWFNYNPAESTFDLFSPIQNHVCGSLGLTGTFHEPTYAAKMGFRLKHQPTAWKNPIMEMKIAGKNLDEIKKIIPILDQLPPYPFPFDSNNFRARVVAGSNLDSNTRNKFLRKIPKQIAILHNNCVNHGIIKNKLIFLPSKALIEAFNIQLKQELTKLGLNDVILYGEDSIKSVEDNKRLMTEFKTVNNAIWIGVMGGRNSEGADYPPNLLDTVIIIGVPYEAWNQLLTNRIEKYSSLFNFPRDLAKIYATMVPAYMKTGQSLGRLIRSNTTKGIILLYDDRFAIKSDQALLPKWFAKELETIPTSGENHEYEQDIWDSVDAENLFK